MESTARAERFELQSAALPAYSWEVPQKPVIVRIPFAVIDKLEGEAVENFRSLNSRGSEIGGVLFGKASNGEPVLVSVEDYELIACDYSRGPLYRLSDSDLAKFDRIISQHAGGNSMPVVGFFRSHTRKGLAIDADDMLLFESRFKDPRKVALLIRPFATKASTAGFFFWEGDRFTASPATWNSPSGRPSFPLSNQPRWRIPVSPLMVWEARHCRLLRFQKPRPGRKLCRLPHAVKRPSRPPEPCCGTACHFQRRGSGDRISRASRPGAGSGSYGPGDRQPCPSRRCARASRQECCS